MNDRGFQMQVKATENCF